MARVLILHDYLDNIGGGEKLMLTLAREIGADVATLDYNPALVEAMGFRGVNVIGFGSTVKVAPVKQIVASLRHWLSDFRGYDHYILSGNWSHYAAARHHPNTWYCYTPVRAFYSDRERLSASLPLPKKMLFRAWTQVHRRFDRRSVQTIDNLISISNLVRCRVKRYYGRDSIVVYPGTDTRNFKYLESGDFWLSVNRLYPEKRVDLQAEVFRRLPRERLVVVGGNLRGDHSDAYVRRLIRDRPPNVEYRGLVDESELAELYGRCRGLICTAVDEDYGMTPVEAMAAGKPVVAVREGGYTETVVHGETGYLVEPTVDALLGAVGLVNSNPAVFRSRCEERARIFDTGVFVSGMRSALGI